MTKGRKTTLEERTGIVVFCLENDHNYVLTAKEFKISYAQVYSWVRKYKASGLAELKDTRGKGKTIEDMTDLEKLKAEKKILEARNYRLQMENDLLKSPRNRKGVWLSAVRLEGQYKAVKELTTQKGYPVITLCQLLNISRSGYYH